MTYLSLTPRLYRLEKKGGDVPRDVPGPARVLVELAWRWSLTDLRRFYFVRSHCSL